MSPTHRKSQESKSHGFSLPDSQSEPGLSHGDIEIINEITRNPLLIAYLLRFLGREETADEAERVALENEIISLREDLQSKGLIGEHALIAADVLREQQFAASGSISGSLFGLVGSYEAATTSSSILQFAWQGKQGIIISEIDQSKLIIKVEEDVQTPSVEFTFNPHKLISQPVYANGALVRLSFGHPNGFIDKALVNATITIPTINNLKKFLIEKKS